MERIFKASAILLIAAISLCAQNAPAQPVHFTGEATISSLAYGPVQFAGSFEYFESGHSWTLHFYSTPGTPDLSLGLPGQTFQAPVSIQTANGLLTIGIGADSFWRLNLWAAEPFVRNAFMETTERTASQNVTVMVSADSVTFRGHVAE